MKVFTEQIRSRMAMLSLKPLLMTLLALVGYSLNAMADGPSDWDKVNPSSDYSQHTVVYATLVDPATGSQVSVPGAKIYAFIDGECRGYYPTSTSTSTTTTDKTSATSIYSIRVGGTDDDLNKSITFKLVVGDAIYSVTDINKSAATYIGDGTLAKPSTGFKFPYAAIQDVTLASFTVNVGETQNLRDIMTISPENASIPDNFDDLCTWDCGNSAAYGEVVSGTNGPELKGLKSTGGFGMYLEFTCEALGLKCPTQFTVCQPITGVTLADGYTSSTTAYVGDNTTLTNYLANCYTVNPEDADTQLKWTTADNTIVDIVDLATSTGVEAQPLKAGTVKLYLKEVTQDATGAEVVGDKDWLTLDVTVEVKPESITSQVYDVYAGVGDDITDIIKANYSVLPADATNKNVTITIEGGKSGEVVVEEKDGKYTTTAEGLSTITITSAVNPDAVTGFNVHVTATPTITIAKDKLAYQTTALPTDIASEIANNYTVTGGDQIIVTCTAGSLNDKDMSLSGNTGTSTVTVSASYQRTQLSSGVLTTNTLVETGTFDVIVSAGLSYIAVAVDGTETQNLSTVKGTATTFTLVTNPADYELDQSLLDVTVSSLFDNTKLVFADLQKKDDGSYTLTTFYPGTGNITITYNEEYMGGCVISSADKISVESGWAWYTFPQYGELTSYFGEAADNKIEEMRSQDYLLYNDPEFGYFGDITWVESATCYKVKANESFDVVLENNGAADEVGGSQRLVYSDYAITLSPKYNWIPNNYLAPHTIADAFAESTPNTDDVILSCSGSIATWTGTAWSGTLTTLQPYTGYIYYNAGTTEETLTYAAEYDLAIPSAAGAKTRRVAAEFKESVWEYDRSEYPNVMAIIANVSNIDNSRRFSIGAFVGDECRGEGTCVDGKFYIGVSGKSGEKVTFKVYDDVTGEYADITNELPFTQLVGSYSKPLALNADMSTTGITTATTSALHSSETYNTQGVRVSSNAKGIVITKDGKKYLNK